jgi:hypothetical protein
MVFSAVTPEAIQPFGFAKGLSCRSGNLGEKLVVVTAKSAM